MTDTEQIFPLERESARQAGDLAALRRMLLVSQGCFSLAFAVCNDRSLRDDLIQRLKAEIPDVVIFSIPQGTSDILKIVNQRLAGSHPEALFVLDLETIVSSQAESLSVLRILNSSRESWEALNCPVLFWVAEYAVTLLATKAPDFWRYRSHQFEFVTERSGPVDQPPEESFPGFAMVDGLPFEEKRFRMADLEQRLREAGDSPTVNLLPHVFAWTYELAHLYGHANRYDRAEALYRQALRQAELAYDGPEHPEVATALNNLALLLKDTNRLAEAEPLMRRALDIDEKSLGPEHPSVATDLNNLASLLQDTNRLAEAEPLIRRALDIDEKSLGPEHPNVATHLNNLASLLKETNRLAEAEPLMRRALDIDEKSLGPEHPNVATRLNNLASLFEETNRLAEAEPLIRRALDIDEKILGPEHPNVATRLNNLASLLEATNRLAEAEPLIRRALDIDEKSLGPEHPNVATRLNNLASLLEATNRLAEAEPLIRRSLDIFIDFTSRTGHMHPHLQIAFRNFEGLLKAMGKAETEIRATLEQLRERCLLQTDSPQTDKSGPE